MARLLVALILASAVALAIAGVRPITSAAQEQDGWSPDAQVPGYAEDTVTPVMIADSFGTVHAFANQWVGDYDPQLAVVYRRWSVQNGWTDPVDVLLAPTGDARVIDAYVDAEGMIHVVFWGSEPFGASIYYSVAPAARASQAPAWSIPQPVGTSPSDLASGALAGDGKGNLVIIYSGSREGSGVYATYSSDAGVTWSDPSPVFLTYDPKLVPYSLDAASDQDEQVHAVWNVVTSTGTDESIHYSRFDTKNQTWSMPTLLEERVDELGFFGPSYPRIADNGEYLVVMYNSGNPFVGRSIDRGRPIQRVRLSPDGGLTWREAVDPFPLHNGRSGEHSIVVDSKKNVHALFIQRIDTLVDGKYRAVGGIQHSTLDGDQWGEPQRFVPALPAVADVRAVISQGNVLLMTWREDQGLGQNGIWYSYLTLDAPELPAVPLPTVKPIAKDTPTPTTPPTSVLAIYTPTSSPQISVERQRNASSGMVGGAAGLLIAATLPVTLVLAAILGFHLRPRGG